MAWPWGFRRCLTRLLSCKSARPRVGFGLAGRSDDVIAKITEESDPNWSRQRDTLNPRRK